MFLDNYEGLKELVDKRLAVKAKIEKARKELGKRQEKIKELTNEIQTIQMSYKDVHQEFADINQEINKMVLMDVWDKLEDTQIPKEVILKDGKPFCEVIDLVEDVKAQAKQAKEDWKKQLEK
jgi:archaellum component FlaC